MTKPSSRLDNLASGYLRDGTRARMIRTGIRVVTANPTIFALAYDTTATTDRRPPSPCANRRTEPLGGGDPSTVRSVASFFVSRVDSEVHGRLEALDGSEVRGLFGEQFSGDRWKRLADLGPNRQRLLCASTSTKNRPYPETMYVDTRSDLTPSTCCLRPRFGLTLENQGVPSFHESFRCTRRPRSSVGAIYAEEHVPDGTARVNYNSSDPNKGHDHTFFIQHSRDVFGD